MMKINKMVKKVDPIRRSYEKIGRNEDCPCNSGKKYKHCCLKTEIELRRIQNL